MTHLLLRLFVRGYDTPDHPAVHAAIGALAGITGMVCNALLFAVKLFVGLAIGSVAVMADAFNNLSDAASSVITYLGFRLAQRPADRDHPYGHARLEYLAGLAIAAMVLFIGLEQGKSAVEKIFHPGPMTFSTLTFALMCAAIALKAWMFCFFRALSRRIGSVALSATAVDSRNDVLATTAVMVGCLVQHITGVSIDGYIGLVVTAMILWSGVGIAKETAAPLLGRKADADLTNRLREIVLSHEAVLGIHDLLVHDYGPGHVYASVHVEMGAETDALVCHDIVDDIEQDVLRELNVELVIHYDPIETNDEERNALNALVAELARNIDPECSVHDVRIVRSSTRPKLNFDMTIPYALAGQQQTIVQQVEACLAQTGRPYRPQIRFDYE